MYNFVFKEKSKETENLNISIFIICYFIYTCIQYALSKLSNLYIHVFHKQSTGIFYKLFLSHSLFLENAFKMYLIYTFVNDLISNKRLLYSIYYMIIIIIKCTYYFLFTSLGWLHTHWQSLVGAHTLTVFGGSINHIKQ